MFAVICLVLWLVVLGLALYRKEQGAQPTWGDVFLPLGVLLLYLLMAAAAALSKGANA
jgi:hypothetical protein